MLPIILDESCDNVVLRDGRQACIRPIRASDLAMHSSFVSNLSLQSRFRRLLSTRLPEDEEVRRWTDIDRRREAALIATTSGEDPEEIGVARYVREESASGLATAGMAVVIADSWQGVGLAQELLVRLIAVAGRDGIEVLSDLTQYDNRAVLRLAKKLGFNLSRSSSDGANVTRVTLQMKRA